MTEGGESGWSDTIISQNRRAAGGGGGVLGPDQAVFPSAPDHPDNQGLLAMSGVDGGPNANGAVFGTSPPRGGARGVPTFIDSDSTNDFTLRWALALTALVFALVLWQVSPRSGSATLETDESALLPEPGAQEELASGANDGGDGERSPAREEVAQLEVQDAYLRIRLLDKVFDQPLIGTVLNENGERLGETDGEGRARLELDSKDLAGFEFRCSGYHSRKLAPGESELAREWVVRLEPLATATIETITPESAPAVGVGIRVMKRRTGRSSRSFRSLPPQADAVWIEGQTDAGGRFSFPLAVPALGEVLSPGGDLARVQVSPGETTRVTVHLEAVRLSFVDAQSGSPLPGFVVETRDALAPRQGVLRRETDEFGQLLVAPGSREFVVDMRDLSFVSATCTKDPRITASQKGHSFRFSEVRAGESFEIRVERCSARLRLVDALSGEPLAGRVSVRFEHGWEREGQATKWSSLEVLAMEAALDGGEFVVDCVYLSRRSSTDRLYLEVAGYEPGFVLQANIEKDGEPRVVFMEPGGRRVRVQVLHADMSPLVGTFQLGDLDTGSISPELKSDEQGWIPSQAWSGGDLEVYCYTRRPQAKPKARQGQLHGLGGGGPARRSIGLIGASAVVDGAATLVLDSSPSYARLAVHGLPDGAPALFALDVDGARRRAAIVSRGEALFERLPVGDYVVGPQRWLDLLEVQYMGPDSDRAEHLRVQVESGGMSEMEWDPRWQLQATLEGRLMCAPDARAELSLRPWYGSREGSIPPYDTERIHLDAEGRYRIAAGEPRPEALLVCTSNSSYWIQVLQAFEPGADTHLALGSMKLTWEGPRPDAQVMVLYSADDLVFDTQFEVKQPNGYYLEWNTDGPLLLNAVSTSVHEVHLSVGKDPRMSFPIAIYAGEQTDVLMSRGAGNPVPERR